ncbi:hypothetical protein P3G55_19650 [Leptospira sp. 96542]|nr:hypothetical protein [Leptospira sp. 96542]
MRFLLFIFPFAVSCSMFFTADIPNVNPPRYKIEKTMGYELIGWEGGNDKQKASILLQAFSKSNVFSTVQFHEGLDTDTNIQIILESSPKFRWFLGETHEPVTWMQENDQGRYLLYIGNRVLSLRSFFVIPDVDRDDDFLVIRIRKPNKLTKEYRYSLESYQMFGWLSLVFMWYDDSKRWDIILTKIVHQFLAEAKDDF